MSRYLPVLALAALAGCASVASEPPRELRLSSSTETVTPHLSGASETRATFLELEAPAADGIAAGESPPESPWKSLPLAPQTQQWPIEKPGPRWKKGQTAAQGFIGASFLEDSTLSGGTPPAQNEEVDLDTMPLIGGGGAVKLWGGDKLDLGLEAGLAFAFQTGGGFFAFGGGGAVVAVDFDTFLLDIYGGPFANIFLGDELRVYGGLGPIWQFVDWSQDGLVSQSGSGSALGLYARTGIETLLHNGWWLGLGARWVDVEVGLSNNLGDLTLDGLQLFMTVTRGI